MHQPSATHPTIVSRAITHLPCGGSPAPLPTTTRSFLTTARLPSSDFPVPSSTCGFGILALSCDAVVLHHCPPTQQWCFCTIDPTTVLLHHLPPTKQWCSCIINHLPYHGFLAPSATGPEMVFSHHRPPTPPLFSCTIACPPSSGVLAPLPTLHRGSLAPSPAHPFMVFLHHHPPSW